MLPYSSRTPGTLLKLMSTESVMPSSHLISVVPFSPAFSLSQHQGLFQLVISLHQLAKSIGASASASVLPVKMSLAIISIKCNKIVALASKFGGSLCNNIYVDHIYSIKTHYSCFLLLYLMFHCKWHLFNFK